MIPLCLLAAVVAMLRIWGPDGATYDEYLQLHEGMSRQEAVDIIGQGDYWFHNEGDLVVTSWINADGTRCTMIFTGKNTNDSWNTVQGRFILRRAR